MTPTGALRRGDRSIGVVVLCVVAVGALGWMHALHAPISAGALTLAATGQGGGHHDEHDSHAADDHDHQGHRHSGDHGEDPSHEHGADHCPAPCSLSVLSTAAASLSDPDTRDVLVPPAGRAVLGESTLDPPVPRADVSPT